jgi:hypothetical protein
MPFAVAALILTARRWASVECSRADGPKYAPLISLATGRVKLRVIHTEEELAHDREGSTTRFLNLGSISGTHESQHTYAGIVPQDGCLLAGRQLSIGWSDLSV